jgi:hypothetical protein
MATLNKPEKLRSDLSVIMVFYHKCASKEAMSKQTFFCFNAAMAILRKLYVVLLLAA